MLVLLFYGIYNNKHMMRVQLKSWLCTLLSEIFLEMIYSTQIENQILNSLEFLFLVGLIKHFELDLTPLKMFKMSILQVSLFIIMIHQFKPEFRRVISWARLKKNLAILILDQMLLINNKFFLRCLPLFNQFVKFVLNCLISIKK